MSDEIKIYKNVPILPRAERAPRIPRRYTYPFSEMEVGDMFKAPIDKGPSISNAAVSYRHRWAKDAMFSVRKISDVEVGCWRIK